MNCRSRQWMNATPERKANMLSDKPLLRYGQWAGDLRGVPEDVMRCVVEVWPKDGRRIPWQCLRKRGYGTDGMYCKQHAKKEERVP